MKNNFKINLVALVAVFSGAAIGNCQAMQEASAANRVRVPEVIQASEASYGGAFNAVRSATQISAFEEPATGVPPIVSASREVTQETADFEFDVPPILTPKNFDSPSHIPPVRQANPPIVRPNPPVMQADSYGAADRQFNPEPEIVSSESQLPQTTPATSSQLLAPMNTAPEQHFAPREYMHPQESLGSRANHYEASPKKSVMLSPITPVKPNPVVEIVEAPKQPAEPSDEALASEKSIMQNQPYMETAWAPATPPKQFVVAPPANINATHENTRSAESLVQAFDNSVNQIDFATQPPEAGAIPVIQATGDANEMETNQEFLQTAQWGQSNLARGVSAAGVPLYPAGAAPQYLPQIVESVQMQPSGSNFAPDFSQSTPPAPSIAPDSRYVSPIQSLTQPGTVPTARAPLSGTAPNNLMRASAPIKPNYRSQQDYFEPQPVEAPVIAAPACPTCGVQMPMNGGMCPNCANSPTNVGCTSCGGVGCPDCGIGGTPGITTSSCQNCGANGCFDPNLVANQFADSGSVAYARRYLIAEGLYMTRRDGVISNSNFGSLADFDWAGGLRLTLGNRRDSIRGNEITYFGTDEITQGMTNFDVPQGRIDARFNAGGGFLPAEISSFKNAYEQSEFKQTELHSLEFNKVEWGWDVVKTYAGLRYLYIEDDYMMSSTSNRDFAGNPIPVESGLFEVYVKNNLIGPNFGTEIYYDVGSRLSATFVARGGLYWSLNQVRTKLNNAGTQFLDVEDNNSTIGGTIELGFNGRFKVARRANLRFGYNALWVNRVAEAANNVPAVITPTIGSQTSDTNAMQFHGANIGFEIFR